MNKTIKHPDLMVHPMPRKADTARKSRQERDTKEFKAALKERRHKLRELNKEFGEDFVEIPRDTWPELERTIAGSPIEAHRNKHFLVQIYQEDGCKRMTVCRTSIGPDGRWKDGITWDTLQEIKRHMGFGDKDAIEVYPNDVDVINVANMRHLFIMPGPIKCAWRANRKAAENKLQVQDSAQMGIKDEESPADEADTTVVPFDGQ